MERLIPVRVVNQIGTIEDNLDAVEASIRKRVEEYGSMAVTEDTVKEGRQSLADIRKEKTALDKERKEIKAQWMKPYLVFEERAKKIIALYDDPIEAINSQIKQYEALQKEEKRKKIQSVYDTVKGEYGDWLPLGKIYDTKWENKSYSPKKIKEDMQRLFGQLEVSISTIKSMDSEFEADALHVLKETGSLQDAVAEMNELQKQKKRFLEQARQEAERRRQEKETEENKPKQEEKAAGMQEAEEKPLAPETLEEPEKPAAGPVPKVPETPAPFAPERTLTVLVKIGENDFGLLRDFLDIAGLEYEVM